MYVYAVKDLFRDGENIVVTRSQFSDSDTLSMHKHECIEIAYVCAGKGYHLLGDKKIKVTEGDIFLIGRNSFHTYERTTSDFCWINVLFLPSAIDKSIFAQTNSDNVLKASFYDMCGNVALYNHKTEFGAIITDMLHEYRSEHADRRNILRCYLQILLMKIFRLSPAPDPAVNAYADIVMEYLCSHPLCDKIYADELARKAFLAPRSFCATFKKATGKTLSAYLTELRIARAKDLLENTSLPVLTIMNEVGYSDSKFFYELFKRHTGLTPGKYRKLPTNE